MKKLLFLVLLLTGCGGGSFTSALGVEEDGGLPATDTGASLGGAPSDDDAGAPVATGGQLGAGGAPGAGGATPGTGGTALTGGSPGAGGAAPETGVCCHFDVPVKETMPCGNADGGAVWWCTGAQTFTCTEPHLCQIGMACYAPGGSAGGHVEACAATKK